jgi:hypothetical protein
LALFLVVSLAWTVTKKRFYSASRGVAKDQFCVVMALMADKMAGDALMAADRPLSDNARWLSRKEGRNQPLLSVCRHQFILVLPRGYLS